VNQLQKHVFSADNCRTELDEFAALLSSKQTLSERADVLPFFKTRLDLSIFISTYLPEVCRADAYAHEFGLSGKFCMDLIAGDTTAGQYLLVEFEDGTADGPFQRRGKKCTPDWHTRFEHAFSQLVDWYWALEDQRSTQDFTNVFGRNARFHSLIVIGKSVDLGAAERSRLEWRTDRVIVDSHKVSCVTFDQLHYDLDWKLKLYHQK
jgi:hypothetical protein